MSQGQRSSRIRRRMEVRYGPEGAVHKGFSGNLSRSGVMIRTTRVFGSGTILSLELQTPDGVITARGRVMWAREGSLSLISTGRIGMGIRFLQTPPGIESLLGLEAEPALP